MAEPGSIRVYESSTIGEMRENISGQMCVYVGNACWLLCDDNGRPLQVPPGTEVDGPP